MEQILNYIDKDFLIGYDYNEFTVLTHNLYLKLIHLSKIEKKPIIILAETNPLKFIAGFLAACAAECQIFLCNPNWVKSEWKQVFNLVQPDLIWGDAVAEIYSLLSIHKQKEKNQEYQTSNFIMIPTGGSSGKLNFAIHTWETLISSVKGFQQYFQVKQVNSYCVLPLYHVSGLMQFMRSYISGGKLVITDFKTIEIGKNLGINPKDFFISLVPTQLQRLLQISETNLWLSRFQSVLLGGAPAWKQLLEKARFARIPLSLTYGMTETASQIATLKPKDFLTGNNSCGQILPHAKITIRDHNGEILGYNQRGIICINADSLALGYYPDMFTHNHNFQTDDLGFFDKQNYLHIIGRKSHKIITGGENVFPSEVEAAILSTNLVTDVCIIGLPDEDWGQIITALYVPINLDVSTSILQKAIADKLSKFKRPKYWIRLESLFRNTQGKVNKKNLEKIANQWIQSQYIE